MLYINKLNNSLLLIQKMKDSFIMLRKNKKMNKIDGQLPRNFINGENNY